jgi:transcriptional regulator with XRE-family HTH domain
VGSQERLASVAGRRAERTTRAFGEELRELRLGRGLSLRAVAARLPMSESKLGRWERGQPPHPTLHDAALVARLLGHDLVLKLYPAGGTLRDEAHVRLVHRFVALLPADVPRRLEAPVGGSGDLRGWDVLLRLGPAVIGVAVETRLRDVQELLRREQAKLRDSAATRLLVVLLDSAHNRRAVRLAGALLRTELPLDGRKVRASLRLGRDPGGNGLLFL